MIIIKTAKRSRKVGKKAKEKIRKKRKGKGKQTHMNKQNTSYVKIKAMSLEMNEDISCILVAFDCQC